MVLALISLGGVIAVFDPVFTAGRIFGTLALGAAAFLAGADVWRARRMSLCTIGLVVLGLTGIFLFPPVAAGVRGAVAAGGRRRSGYWAVRPRLDRVRLDPPVREGGRTNSTDSGHLRGTERLIGKYDNQMGNADDASKGGSMVLHST